MRFFALLVWVMAAALGDAQLAIRNVTVINPGGPLPAATQTIVIDGERILRITNAADVPANATVVDGSGRYAIPGLWDMHASLASARNPLPAYVARGITGVSGVADDLERVQKWRADAENGTAIGPHVIAGAIATASNPEAARRAVERLEAADADFISLGAGLDRSSFRALAERARQSRIPFTGELLAAINAREAIDARQSIIERLPAFVIQDEQTAQEMFHHAAVYDTRVMPMLASVERDAPRFAAAARAVRQMRDAGVEILAAGAGNLAPGVGVHHELELMVRAGLTPAEALRTATTNPARHLGWQRAVGTLAEGMVADVVLLDANPLADIRNVARIAGVTVRGRYVSRARLNAILEGEKRDARRTVAAPRR